MARVDQSDIVPGSLQLIVEEVPASKQMPKQRAARIEAHDPAIGQSLKVWLDKFGGAYSGEIPDPTGRPTTVSLDAWKGRDPNATFVRVYFRFQQKSLLGTRVTPRT